MRRARPPRNRHVPANSPLESPLTQSPPQPPLSLPTLHPSLQPPPSPTPMPHQALPLLNRMTARMPLAPDVDLAEILDDLGAVSMVRLPGHLSSGSLLEISRRPLRTPSFTPSDFLHGIPFDARLFTPRMHATSTFLKVGTFLMLAAVCHPPHPPATTPHSRSATRSSHWIQLLSALFPAPSSTHLLLSPQPTPIATAAGRACGSV